MIENFECLIQFLRPNRNLSQKMKHWTIRLGIEPRPRESSAMLHHPSYGSPYREYGHEFSILYGDNADEVKGYIRWNIVAFTLDY